MIPYSNYTQGNFVDLNNCGYSQTGFNNWSNNGNWWNCPPPINQCPQQCHDMRTPCNDFQPPCQDFRPPCKPDFCPPNRPCKRNCRHCCGCGCINFSIPKSSLYFMAGYMLRNNNCNF